MGFSVLEAGSPRSRFQQVGSLGGCEEGSALSLSPSFWGFAGNLAFLGSWV